MKKNYILAVALLSFIIVNSQTQIGQNINGEAEGDNSGFAVSLNSNGNIIAIGATGNDGNGVNSGHARVYELVNGAWGQLGQDIDGESADDTFGRSIDLNSNGNIVAIGSINNDGNGNSAGHVRVFQYVNDNWIQVGQDIDGETAEERFGWNVDLDQSGNILAVSSSGSGNVRIFQNINNNWTQIGQNILVDPNSASSISLSDNGNFIVIGAPNDSQNATNSGKARVYQNISGTWTQIGQDLLGDATDGDLFGLNVSISNNGNIIAIMSIGTSSQSAGRVKIYQNIGNNWFQLGILNGSSEDDQFGRSMDLDEVGNIIAIGSWRNDDNGSNSGKAQIFKNISGIWTQIGQDINGDQPDDILGYSVSLNLDGGILAVGITGGDENNINSGQARVYSLNNVLSNQNFESINFNIIPNPSKDQISIILEENIKIEKISLYNNLGQLVKQSIQKDIDISQLKSGIYFVEIQSNLGKSTEKLIVE